MAGLFGSDKTISNTETKLGALRIQNSAQGFPVPLVYGRTRITSNLLWYGDFTAIANTTSTEAGGKGGGSTTVENTTYTYTTAVVFGLCEGPVFQSNFIGTIWSNKEKTTATQLALSQFQGTYNQAAWSYLSTNHANEALNYRGTAYAAASALSLGSSDGLPNLSFEVTGFLANGDVPVSAVIPDILTAANYGAGWPSAQLGNLTAFASYCNQAGFVVSPAYVAQRPATQIVADLVRIANSAPVWSDGLLKIIPYADTPVGSYTPDLTIRYDLGYDDFMAGEGEDPVNCVRKRQADAYNVVRVECLDRGNEYNPYVAEAKDQLAIDLYGERILPQIKAQEICDPTVARLVAQSILQRELYVRNVYQFRLGWKYARLEPMDCVSLTDEALGLNLYPVRILSIEEDEEGYLSVEAEELQIGVSTPQAYAVQTVTGSSPGNSNPPGNAIAPVIFQPPLALTQKPQIWIGTAGGANWGGAEVWASTDNTTFTRMGQVTGPARIGVLTSNFPTGTDPQTVVGPNLLNVSLTQSNGSLTSAANSAADAQQTLSYLDGELINYTTATLIGGNNYAISGYMRRGQAGSSISAHLTGSKFMRLDSSVAAFDISPSLFGTTIYVKLLSYNKTGGAMQALSDVAATAYNIQTQVISSGSGVPYYADRSTSNMTDPGAGYMRFNNATQSQASQVAFDILSAQGANMSDYFLSVGSAGFLDLRDSLDTAKWATYTINAANNAGGFYTFNVSYTAGGAEFANKATIVATFSPTPPTGVTSVGLSLPAALFNVANSPVTSVGTLTGTLVAQAPATFFAGPTSGNSAAPSFRALEPGDMNAANVVDGYVLTAQNGVALWAAPTGNGGGGNGSGTVTSVGLVLPATVFNVSGSPVTAAGNLTATFVAQNQKTFFAGPASGSAAQPSFRTFALTDLPAAGVTDTYVVTAQNGVAVWAPQSGNGGGGGGNGTSKVTRSAVSLGNQAAGQANFTYTTVSNFAGRGLMSNFVVTTNVAAPLFDVVVRGAGNDSGSLWLQAISVTGNYTVTLPVYFENDSAGQDFYIGIRNRGTQSVAFTLAGLRAEKFA